MSFDPRSYFRQTCNKRRIHIEQLRSVRDDENTNATVRRRLNNKIIREREQLEALDEIWDVR